MTNNLTRYNHTSAFIFLGEHAPEPLTRVCFTHNLLPFSISALLPQSQNPNHAPAKANILSTLSCMLSCVSLSTFT